MSENIQIKSKEDLTYEDAIKAYELAIDAGLSEEQAIEIALEVQEKEWLTERNKQVRENPNRDPETGQFAEGNKSKIESNVDRVKTSVKQSQAKAVSDKFTMEQIQNRLTASQAIGNQQLTAIYLAALYEKTHKRSAFIRNDKKRNIDVCNIRNVQYTSEVLEDAERSKKLLVRTYPILFDIPTKIQDEFGEYEEIVKPDALRGINFEGVKILGGHDPNVVLGVVGKGGTRMEVDNIGVFAEVDLAYPNTQSARDWYNMVEKGLVDGASYGFKTKSLIVNGVREIRDMELFEVSLVAFPAYYEASVVASRKCNKDDEECKKKKRSEEEIQAEISELEKALKELKEA